MKGASLMKSLILALGLIVGSFTIASAEDARPSLFTVEVGPGFLTALEDTIDADRAETFFGASLNLGSRISLGARADVANELGSNKISGTFWGYARGYLTGPEGGFRTYIHLGVSTALDVSIRGGGEINIADSIATFLEVEGRLLDEEDFDAVGVSLGLRAFFGRRGVFVD